MNNRHFFRQLITDYSKFRDPEVSGRFLSYTELKPRLEELRRTFEIQEIGKSHLDIPIHSVRLGSGPVKILAWSQMHGNESTTTKSLLDLFRLFSGQFYQSTTLVSEILEKCTFLVIPMLNPDGAARYTRENVNKVDLNRDAQQLKEVESRVLRSCFESFQPVICFNLHDQRTIFSAGNTTNPATISFLSPAEDPERKITSSRRKSMQLIAAMNEVLQEFIPGNVGRYDDAFNINCTGDTFQSLKTPTILFEAGHYKGDYLREKTREYMTVALIAGLSAAVSGENEKYSEADYLRIPENRKNFLDIILRNALSRGEGVDIGIQYQEKVRGRAIEFFPVVQVIADELLESGLQEIDCEHEEVRTISGQDINENDLVSKILLNNEELSIKPHDIP